MSGLNAPGPKPVFVAIVGGSGSGKSWLAGRLEKALAGLAARLSQDDFYRDRSYLAPSRRRLINFDHPRAIDWAELERALHSLRIRGRTEVPRYDFTTHCRLPNTRLLAAKPVVLVEGLWLLRRPSVRRLFALRIFIDCAARTRLRRRISRDQRCRGRTARSIREQFGATVEPMHRRFVLPQAAHADIVLRSRCDSKTVHQLASHIRSLTGASR